MMKKILVPCDFSAPARQAYKFAVELASASGGEIFVFHAVTIPILYESTFGFQPYPLEQVEVQRLESNAKQAFERMQKAHPSPENVNVRFFPMFDFLIPGIREFTAEKKFDLIVMGTNGSSGLEEFLIGSNTEKVVRFSSIPVIAVRMAPFLSSIKNIVLPSTLDLNQIDFMAEVKKLQKFFNATLHILLVNTPTHFRRDVEAKEAIHEFAKFYKLENYTANFRNNQFERNGIIDFVHEIKGDLLAMGTHGKQGLAHLFTGSVTESVVNHIDCPIWTYKIHKK